MKVMNLMIKIRKIMNKTTISINFAQIIVMALMNITLILIFKEVPLNFIKK